MILAGHHTLMLGGVPSVFNYICVKYVGYRHLRDFSNLTTYQNTSGGQYDQTMFQWSRVDFIDGSGAYFSYPANMTVQTCLMFDGNKMWTKPVLPSMFGGSGNLDKMLDHSTSTKFCVGWWLGTAGGASDLYYVTDTDFSAPEDERPYAYSLRSTYTAARNNSVLGGNNRPLPFSAILDLSDSPIDITTFSRWCFYSANDTANAVTGVGQRQWAEGESLGSVDGNTWWRLDVFNDLTLPITNYALSYTGNLIPRKGDLWSDLDLAERDWANGIAVDGI